LAFAAAPRIGRIMPCRYRQRDLGLPDVLEGQGLFKNIDGIADPGGNTLRKMNELAPGGGVLPPSPPLPPLPPIPPAPPGPPAFFNVRDVRLAGWKPSGDVLEVNGDTPLQWMLDNTIERGKKNGGILVPRIMAHGLPGFVQCCQGSLLHPTLSEKVYHSYLIRKVYIGPGRSGISAADPGKFKQLAGHVRRIEFHSCLVARIGPCHEANGHLCYDGNAFCFKLAQAVQAEVKASVHLQYYWPGEKGINNGINFGHWNGLVFTWGPAGNIVEKKMSPTRKGRAIASGRRCTLRCEVAFCVSADAKRSSVGRDAQETTALA
jgi:hypothetical protein